MTSVEWIGAIRDATLAFARTRGAKTPAVRVRLSDGDQFFLHRAEAGPTDHLVTLSPYPPERDEDMVKSPSGAQMTPRAVVVPPAMVAKVEILVEAPTEQEFGFQVPEEP